MGGEAASDNNGYSRHIDTNTYAQVMGSGFGGTAESGQSYDAQDGYGHASRGQGSANAGEPVVGLRFASALIDTIVMVVLYFLVCGAMGAVMAGTGAEEVTDSQVLSVLAMMILPGMLYGILMESSPLQGTLGKVMTGTVIMDKQGNRISFMRAVGRNFGKLLSACMPFYFPYWMVFASKNKQSLHDMMSGTLVFKKGEGPAETVGQVFA